MSYLFFSLCALYWCLCFLQILGIYWFNRVWARGLPIIDKRYPQFVVVEAAAVCFNLAVFLPALISAAYGYPEISGEWWFHLCRGLNIPNLLIVPCIEICRIWLIPYDLQYLNSWRNQQWKTEIDASYAEKDWYLRNRGKWGNRQYVVRLGFVFYTVATTVALVTFFIDIVIGVGGLATIPLSIAMLTLTLIPLYLYMKTPRNLQDQCLFQFEFEVTAVVFTIGLFSWISTIILHRFVSPTVGITLGGCTTVICNIMPSILSTLVIPHKVNSMSEWNGQAKTLRIKIKETSDNFNQKIERNIE